MQVSARVPTATLREVPPHANAFAIVFANPSVIPFFQLGVLLDRRGILRWTRSLRLFGSHRVLLGTRSVLQRSLHILATMSIIFTHTTQHPATQSLSQPRKGLGETLHA